MKKKSVFSIAIYAIVLVVAFTLLLNIFASNANSVPYSKVLEQFETENVISFEVDGNMLVMTLRNPVEGKNQLKHQLADPDGFRQEMQPLFQQQMEKGVLLSYDFLPQDTLSPFDFVIPIILAGLVLIIVWGFVAGKAANNSHPLNNFGKANVINGQVGNKVTFRDVAGMEEEKKELQEIVEFLRNPEKFTKVGAAIPHGILLYGPPGTGKTLLARAVAGEAGVQFLSISGSDFMEMYVGVGASRVRDLFQQATKVAPSIVFIDEIDAVGRSRDSRFGNNDQTLNQLLGELDGFDSSKGVVILAATNRPEILDKALLRAGRFDRRIVVDRPNLQGRWDTLKVHTRKIKLAEDVDLKKIAQATAGAVGADLANLVNEAALRAVRQGRQMVNQEDLLVSFETVIAGTEKKNTVLGETEKRMVAYHEVGHALISALEKHDTPVSKITIVPHTDGALGYTLYLPEEEKYLSTKEELLVQLRSLLGGRAAEQLVFGTVTTGAANDLQRATALARNMVALYGMSDELGLMAPASITNQYLEDHAQLDCSQATAATIDTTVQKILTQCFADAMRILTENRELLDEISEYLLVKESITGDDLMAFIDPEKKAELLARDAAEKAAEEAKTAEEAAKEEPVTEETTEEKPAAEETPVEEASEEATEEKNTEE